jgi:hypothetical protein
MPKGGTVATDYYVTASVDVGRSYRSEKAAEAAKVKLQKVIEDAVKKHYRSAAVETSITGLSR